ncbi:TRAP transporter small permease subunit [Rhizobiaceae bacterium n13]|uniref:TRAP transporter small permease protein n=2 Tax=Ferirhizobium litorale TaxID=2927786 RepID=A0AAE3U5A8_9HYPH|nr:TRAP transporter small permease subunit [Fererhizobium litorale]MDI7862653.1 TRAP transporter small permease subunit [Fererhizobium litorale]MDI7923864.1 TRAP transporter small permease subunit [Fererhizobium litorale]
MPERMLVMGAWLRARAENVLAFMLFGMFAVFLLQILFRYVLNLAIGWTHEVSVALWIWVVLFGSAFVVRESEEIRFDFFWAGASNRARRIMTLIFALALVVAFGVSLPAVIDYVMFMKVEKTAYLKIRFDYLYSIYIVFAVAMIVRYIWLGWQAIFGTAPEAFDPTKASSGV